MRSDRPIQVAAIAISTLLVLGCAGVPGASENATERSGGGGLAAIVGGSPSAPSVAWTTWSLRTGKYRWDMTLDDQKAASDWLGDGAVSFTESAETVDMPFTKGAIQWQKLDACHLGGIGPHPQSAEIQEAVICATRTWPPCGPSAYDGLPLSMWSIRAGTYRFSMSFDKHTAYAEWLGESRVPFQRKGDTLAIEFPEGPVALTRVDACHWAGRGPHPHTAGETLIYRVSRTWPDCGGE